MNHGAFIEAILAKEQGYVNDPHDRGGETNYGITVQVARRHGYTGPMLLLPKDLAREIYLKRYITEPGFDKIAEWSSLVADELIDTGVNMGPSRPSEMFQRWLNAFNDGARRYEDLFVDGRIGPATVHAFQAYLEQRGPEGESVMLMALNCTQGVRYLEIAENSPSQERFMYGWMRSRVADVLKGVRP